MKKTILAMTVAVTTAGTAAAADLPRGPAPYYPPPASVYNWAGFYAGLNLGYEWGKVTNSGINPSGVAGGGQVGYNWQIGQFVFGAETDIQASAADDTFAPYKFSNPWFGTLRGRAGFAINNILLYGTARSRLRRTSRQNSAASMKARRLSAGPPVSAWKSALRRTGRRRSSTSTWISAAAPIHITGADNGLQASFLRLGVNYHF